MLLGLLLRNGFGVLKSPSALSSALMVVSPCRLFTTTRPQRIKEISETRVGDCLQFEGITKESTRAAKLLPEAIGNQRFCPECTLGLEVKHTDVLILSQYVRTDGCMLPRRITGLCRRQQKKMGALVTMAQKAGLMPNLAPAGSKKDPKRRRDWRKFNKYFDEATIRLK